MDWLQSAWDRFFTHTQPSREIDSVCADADRDAAGKPPGWNPSKPVDGREAGFGVVEGEKLTHKSFHIASASGIARDGAEFTNVQFIQLFRHDI